MFRFEISLWTTFLLGCLFKVLSIVGGNILIVFSLLILSFFYFLFSFALFNHIKFIRIFSINAYTGINSLKIIFSILCGSAISLFLMGVLFDMMHYYGGWLFLTLGIASLLIGITIDLVKIRKTSIYTIHLLIRLFVIIIIGVFFTFVF